MVKFPYPIEPLTFDFRREQNEKVPIAYAPIKDGSYHLLVIYDPLKPSQMGTEAP
jgi:hypothetical protein